MQLAANIKLFTKAISRSGEYNMTKILYSEKSYSTKKQIGARQILAPKYLKEIHSLSIQVSYFKRHIFGQRRYGKLCQLYQIQPNKISVN